MKLNTDEYLFHYTSLGNLAPILNNGLRFNAVCKQADYHEGKYKTFKVVYGGWRDGSKTKEEQFRDDFSISFDEIQIISLVQNGVPYIEKYYDEDRQIPFNYRDRVRDKSTNKLKKVSCIVDNINRKYICETKGYYNNYMWERYGDKHSGICLIIDKKQLLEELTNKYGELSINQKVEYRSNEITNHLNNRNNTTVHLFQKDLTYSHENEYRLLLSKKMDENDRDFVGKNSIKGVIVGENLEQEIKFCKKFKDITTNYKIYDQFKNTINFYCLQKDWIGQKSEYDVFEM